MLDMLAQLEAYLEEQVAADEFSGAVLVAREGEPIFTRAYGLASKAFGVPNRVDTRFNLGSMNKMFTAVAIMQLAERGTLALDAPLAAYLPEYSNCEVAERVTLHHLLTHTSGLGTYFNDRFEALRATLTTVAAHIPLFVDDPLAFAPGERFQYSNAGYILLGAVVERMTGKDYYDYVREHVYAPAGMRDTDAFELDRDVSNLAIGYTHVGPDGTPEPGEWRNNLLLLPARGGPAGGGYSTVADLYRFVSAVRGHRLLAPETTAMMLAGKTAGPTRAFSRYGYGFGEELLGGERIVGHSGGAPGINAQLDIYLERGYTVAVLANYDPPAAHAVASRIRELLLAPG